MYTYIYIYSDKKFMSRVFGIHFQTKNRLKNRTFLNYEKGQKYISHLHKL